MLKNSSIPLILILLTVISLQSCGSKSVYEKQINFENAIWDEDSIHNFNFNITNNGKYNVYVSIKSKTDYPFSNLYLKAILKSEKSTLKNSLQEIILFDKKTGKPYGKGFAGIMENKFYSINNIELKEGKHTFTLQQYMREKKLTGILSVGVTIEQL